MTTVIKGTSLKRINNLGKPGNIAYGICSETVDNPKIVMGHTVNPPGFGDRSHYHANCSVGQFVISGHRRIFIGPYYEVKEYDLEPGDFIYISQGEIHRMLNLSDTEPSEIVFCYIGVNSMQEAITIYVEPPLK